MSRAYSLPEALAFERTLTPGDFELFARVTGDANPLPQEEDPGGRPRAQGMLLYAVIWGAIHEARPNAVTRRVNLTWPAPALAGEKLSFELTPTDTNGGIRFRVMRPDGLACCEGQTRIGAMDDALIVSDDMAIGTPVDDVALLPRLGARARVDRKFTPADIGEFAVAAGLSVADFGYLPEPLLGALFSQILATRLPGKGALASRLQLEFAFSTTLYEPITAAVEVLAMDVARGQVTLRALTTQANGTILADGRALVSTTGRPG